MSTCVIVLEKKHSADELQKKLKQVQTPIYSCDLVEPLTHKADLNSSNSENNESQFTNQLNFIQLFNSQSFVQFLHRTAAYTILAFTLFIGIKMFFDKQIRFWKDYFIVFFILTIQVLLGIFTLISGLNLYLASMHQITSVILVISVLNLNHKLS